VSGAGLPTVPLVLLRQLPTKHLDGHDGSASPAWLPIQRKQLCAVASTGLCRRDAYDSAHRRLHQIGAESASCVPLTAAGPVVHTHDG
jgi:hypothetical protein